MPKGKFYPYRPPQYKMSAISSEVSARRAIALSPNRERPAKVGDRVRLTGTETDKLYYGPVTGIVVKVEWLAFSLGPKFCCWSVTVKPDGYPWNDVIFHDDEPEKYNWKGSKHE